MKNSRADFPHRRAFTVKPFDLLQGAGILKTTAPSRKGEWDRFNL